MAELKMGEFVVSKYGETIYIAGSVLHPSIEGTLFFYEANWQANLVALSEIMCAAL